METFVGEILMLDLGHDEIASARRRAGAPADLVTAQQTAKSATQQKSADRAAAVCLDRALVGQLQTSAEVDDTERTVLS